MRSIKRPTRDILEFALVALAYAVAARLSLSLALVRGQVTPIWPPTGIALVSLLLIGRRVWPAITLAAFAVNLPIGPSPIGAAIISIGNTLAPLVASEVLRLVDFHVSLDRLRDALAIILIGALGGMTISATIGSSVLLASGAIHASAFGSTWAVWWTGDAMGVLLVAPFLLSLITGPSIALRPSRRGLGLFTLLVITGLATYVLFQNRLDLEYLVLLLIMASAWWFHLRGATPAALLASVIAIGAAIQGVGPFFGESLLEKMVTLQVFNVTVALTALLLSIFVDTREREGEMARLYASAQLTSESKSHFLHMAAHELRTPVTIVIGYASMLADGTFGRVPDSWKKSLDIIIGKGRELNQIVTDLLEASRIEAGAVQGNHDQLDLRMVIQDASERARPRALLLGAAIETRLTTYPVLVEGDAAQLGRILDNLINNALTYTFNQPRVTISTSGENGRALIRVADNGAGIPESEWELVFEQFHRGSQPEFQNIAGTGLGLFIGSQLAKAHGGKLSVESSTPAGTVFALDLPISKPVID